MPDPLLLLLLQHLVPLFLKGSVEWRLLCGVIFTIPVAIINMGAKAYKAGASPKRGARCRSGPGDSECVPGRPWRWRTDDAWVLWSFHGPSLCSSVQAVAAREELAPGETACAHSAVASVQRFQLGRDQQHRQEAGGAGPSLTWTFCSTLFLLQVSLAK